MKPRIGLVSRRMQKHYAAIRGALAYQSETEPCLDLGQGVLISKAPPATGSTSGGDLESGNGLKQGRGADQIEVFSTEKTRPTAKLNPHPGRVGHLGGSSSPQTVARRPMHSVCESKIAVKPFEKSPRLQLPEALWSMVR